MGDFSKKSRTIHVNDMDELIGKVPLIDIREPYEYQDGTIRTAENIPMGELLDNPESYLGKEKTYYLMCRSGSRSRQACELLARQGYDVMNVEGGILAYQGNNRS